ncbi:MAG: beta-lactamase family protein [Rhodobacteraceae bacterium]|nr:beta-lactamase family protein [Paracoccaceae bacterium]
MTAGKFRSTSLDANRLGRIKTWMQGYVDARKFAGSSLLITQAGTEVFSHVVGVRDRRANLPFTRDTTARIYSMTKPITTVALMMLVEQGRTHLDAPVSDYLPAFNDMHALIPGATEIGQTTPCATPTLHQLLTHTSGLSYPFNPGVMSRAMDEADLLFKPTQGTLEAMTNQLATFPLAFCPGKRWEYSVGIDVIGRVIEVITGKTLAVVFDEEIFAPLNMTNTGFTAQQGTEFASLYTPLAGDAMALNAAPQGGETLRMVDQAGSSAFEKTTLFSGGGGLVGTIDDYMRFVEMLRRGGTGDIGRLLSPSTVAFMRQNHLPGDIASMGPKSFAEQPMHGTGFGLGGSVVLSPGQTCVPSSIGDFSWGGMASTFFWLDPVHDLNVVFFTQLSPSSSYSARPELKALIHGCLI